MMPEGQAAPTRSGGQRTLGGHGPARVAGSGVTGLAGSGWTWAFNQVQNLCSGAQTEKDSRKQVHSYRGSQGAKPVTPPLAAYAYIFL